MLGLVLTCLPTLSHVIFTTVLRGKYPYFTDEELRLTGLEKKCSHHHKALNGRPESPSLLA